MCTDSAASPHPSETAGPGPPGSPVPSEATGTEAAGGKAAAGDRELRLVDLGTLVEASQDAIFAVDPDHRVTAWNRGAQALFGWPEREILGRSVEVLVPAERHAEVGDLLTRASRGEAVTGYETVRLARDGTAIAVSLTVGALHRADGAFAGKAVVSQDLRPWVAQSERFRVVFEAAACGLLIVADTGVIVAANQQAVRLFGYPPAELVGLAVDRLVPGPARERHGAHRARFHAHALAQSMASDREVQARHASGRLFPVEVGLSPLPLAPEPSVVVSVVDIGARLQAQRDAAQARELERSNRDLEEFAYAISHDLQEPLRSIMIYGELLAERYRDRLDACATGYLEAQATAGGRMRQMIMDLLAYARAGACELRTGPTDAGEVVRLVLEDLHQQISEAGACVQVGRLPVVAAVPGVLHQVFQNLISNAVKFRGPGPPRIDITARRTGDGWEFAVADNGIGIAPRSAEQIFLMFRRLHGPAAYPGSGIGLALVRRLVERTGGRVWCRPGPRGGTTFHFTLPDDRHGSPAGTGGGARPPD